MFSKTVLQKQNWKYENCKDTNKTFQLDISIKGNHLMDNHILQNLEEQIKNIIVLDYRVPEKKDKK